MPLPKPEKVPFTDQFQKFAIENSDENIKSYKDICKSNVIGETLINKQYFFFKKDTPQFLN